MLRSVAFAADVLSEYIKISYIKFLSEFRALKFSDAVSIFCGTCLHETMRWKSLLRDRADVLVITHTNMTYRVIVHA